MNNNKFKDILQRKNMTIYALSKLTGLDDRGLGKMINGITANPRIDTLIKIAQELGLSNDEFAELCGYIDSKIDQQ